MTDERILDFPTLGFLIADWISAHRVHSDGTPAIWMMTGFGCWFAGRGLTAASWLPIWPLSMAVVRRFGSLVSLSVATFTIAAITVARVIGITSMSRVSLWASL